MYRNAMPTGHIRVSAEMPRSCLEGSLASQVNPENASLIRSDFCRRSKVSLWSLLCQCSFFCHLFTCSMVQLRVLRLRQHLLFENAVRLPKSLLELALTFGFSCPKKELRSTYSATQEKVFTSFPFPSGLNPSLEEVKG